MDRGWELLYRVSVNPETRANTFSCVWKIVCKISFVFCPGGEEVITEIRLLEHVITRTSYSVQVRRKSVMYYSRGIVCCPVTEMSTICIPSVAQVFFFFF